MYDGASGSDGSSRPAQGQRCTACGQFEADPWARFCGVCGGALAPASAAGRGPAPAPPAAPTPYAPAPPGGPPPYQPPAAYSPAPAAPYAPAPAAQNAPITYTVPSIGYLGPARIGAAVSAAFTLLPSVLFAFAGIWLINRCRELLDSWRTATIPVPVPLVTVNLNMNFIDLLQLRALHDRLIYWDEHLWLAFAGLWLVPWILWIIAGALFAVLLALVYNLIGKLGGGMRVALHPTATGPGGPPPGSWQQPQPQPNWPPAPHR